MDVFSRSLFADEKSLEQLAQEQGLSIVNRDGNPLLKPSGEPDVDAQPPFLLRFSPAFFAKEVPSVFQHDPATNSLFLRDGVDAPWFASGHTGVRWHYCKDCAAQWLGKDAKKAHIPRRPNIS